tara:strand:+ start:3680 stop:7063 length:3384 start_codon:yes stop_codon:yes gene_type:complete
MKIKIPIWHGGLVTYGDTRDLDESTSPYTINTNIQRPGTLRNRRTDRRLTTLAERSIDAGVNVRHPDIVTNQLKASDIHGSEIWYNDPEYVDDGSVSDSSNSSGSGSGDVGAIGDALPEWVGNITNYLWIVYDKKNQQFVLMNQDFYDVGISSTGGQWVYNLQAMSGLEGLPKFYSIGNAVYISYGGESLPHKVNFYNRDIQYFGTIFKPWKDEISGVASGNVLMTNNRADTLSNVHIDIQSPTIRNGYLKFQSISTTQEAIADAGFNELNQMRYLMSPIIDGVTEMPMFQTGNEAMTSSIADDGHTIQRSTNNPGMGFKNDLVIKADLKKFDPRITGVAIYRAENLDGNSDTSPFPARDSDWRKIKHINFVVPTNNKGRNLDNTNMYALSDSIYIPPQDGLPQWRWKDDSFWQNGDGITGGFPQANIVAYGSDTLMSLGIVARYYDGGSLKRLPLAIMDDITKWNYTRNTDPSSNAQWNYNWLYNHLHTDSYNYDNEAFFNGQVFRMGGFGASIRFGGFNQAPNSSTNPNLWSGGNSWFRHLPNSNEDWSDATTILSNTMSSYWTDPQGTDVDPSGNPWNTTHIWTKNFCMLNGTLYCLSNDDPDVNNQLYDNTNGVIKQTTFNGAWYISKIPNVELELVYVPVGRPDADILTGNAGVQPLQPLLPSFGSPDYQMMSLKYDDGSYIRLKDCSFGQNIYMKRDGHSMVQDELRGRQFVSGANYSPADSEFAFNNGGVLGNDSRCVMIQAEGNSNAVADGIYWNSLEQDKNKEGIIFDPDYPGLSGSPVVQDGSLNGIFCTTSDLNQLLDTTFVLQPSGTDIHIGFTDENIAPGVTATTIEHHNIQTKYECSAFHMGRMFVGNVIINADTDPEEYQDMIIFSDVGQYDKLSPVNYIQIKDSNSGTIQAMVSLGSSIAVFMENSIYNLHTPSIDPSQFRIMEAVDYLGLVSNSICTTLGAVFFASHDGVYKLTKGNFAIENISLPIKDEYMNVGGKQNTQLAYHSDNNSLMCIFGDNKDIIYEFNITSQTWSLNSWRTAELSPLDTNVPIPEDNHTGDGSPLLLNSVLGDVVAIDNLGKERNTFFETAELDYTDNITLPYEPPVSDPTYPDSPVHEQTIVLEQQEESPN